MEDEEGKVEVDELYLGFLEVPGFFFCFFFFSDFVR
jgi:hypothetical protein